MTSQEKTQIQIKKSVASQLVAKHALLTRVTEQVNKDYQVYTKETKLRAILKRLTRGVDFSHAAYPQPEICDIIYINPLPMIKLESGDLESTIFTISCYEDSKGAHVATDIVFYLVGDSGEYHMELDELKALAE